MTDIYYANSIRGEMASVGDDMFSLHHGERCRGLIHDDDFRLPIDGSRDSDCLSLTALQPRDGPGLLRNLTFDTVEEADCFLADRAVVDERQDSGEASYWLTPKKYIRAH